MVKISFQWILSIVRDLLEKKQDDTFADGCTTGKYREHYHGRSPWLVGFEGVLSFSSLSFDQ